MTNSPLNLMIKILIHDKKKVYEYKTLWLVYTLFLLIFTSNNIGINAKQ